MNGLTFTLFGALAVGASAAYWLAARGRAPRPGPAAPRAKTGGRFGAVQIRPRGNACRAARLLEGHRFLAKNAPALPLRECTAARCACTFSKLPDRRSDGRRLDHGGLSAQLFVAMSRRKRRDRRRAVQSPRHS
jgi:hypothetical protein